MKRQDIDQILKRWKFEPGEVSARLIRGGDGRELLQMRIDMGVLQLEVDNRPDGARPGGAETYFDHLLALSVREGEGFVLDEEQCAEADDLEEDELVARLDELRESVREHYHLGRTLNEQLAEAVAAEEFEKAARLRDEIAKRASSRR